MSDELLYNCDLQNNSYQASTSNSTDNNTIAIDRTTILESNDEIYKKSSNKIINNTKPEEDIYDMPKIIKVKKYRLYKG